MNEIRVWAPDAELVEVVVGGEAAAMTRDDGGWWRSSGDALRPGVDYAFRLDGGEPLPDPRSRWQPGGVHAASRVDDPASFEWSDAGFVARPLSAAVLYELHVGTFSPEGTFDGAAARLDHLIELGVTHVSLMPVNAFSGTRGWGYDGVDLFAVHEPYGGPEGLRRFVDTCHARGLAVIVDVVYNHLGPEGGYLARFGPYFTERYHTPWGAAVNLDGPGSDEVRRFFLDNAAMWLRDYHADGLRIDAVHAFLDTSATHILEEMAAETALLSAELGRPLALIAESDLCDPRLLRSRDAFGFGLDAQWSDDFHHALHSSLTGERTGYYADFGSLAQIGQALREGWVYAGVHSPYRARRHGRPLGDISGNRLLGYSQTHDQVGNRAVGERLCHLVSIGRAKIAAALTMTAPFVPMLFQGEEWAASTPFLYFTSHEDAELGRAVSRGRRREFKAFGWKPSEVPDPQEPETFARSVLRWDERDSGEHGEMLAFYRALVGLRSSELTLRDGRRDRVEVETDDGAGWLRVKRGEILLVANLGDEVLCRSEPGACLLLGSEDGVRIEGDALTVPGDAVAIARITSRA